jgi:Reverse transcriptase (RNA-dependent DNA polymerase)
MLCEMDNAPRRSARVPVPNCRYFNPDNTAHRHQELGNAELLAAAYVGRDPASYAEAMQSDNTTEWTDACQYEIDALSKNNTWELVDLPAGRKAVKSKWVFKLKSDGRYRARLVAKGFTQIPGIDYDETFSPVARFESLRLLLALAALEDWEIHQLDVKSAFLNGVLDEEIYMEQPQGFIIAGKETKVCRLRKAIYGLKQASRAWNQQFHGVLIELGFTRTFSDAGIYVYQQRGGDGPLFIILYVDDITILGASLKAVKRLKADLSKRYEITDLGEIESYLGIRITRDRPRKRLEIDQSGYITDVLDRFGMADANPHNTPLPAGAEVHLVKYTEQASQSEIKNYQSLIGSLLYVQIGTRPDISFAVSRLAQYAVNPSPQHLRLAQYILSYLVGSVDTRICYDGANGDGLHGYSDSSLGDQTDDRHSTSGYVFLLANGATSWSSRKQKTVAQNTTEAEYMAMTDAANQAAWYRGLLKELGYSVDNPIPIHGDNKGAIDLALNPVTGRRSKHIDIKHHVIREYIDNEQISLVRTPTTEMVADGFTKALSRTLLTRHNTSMGLTMS